MAVPRLAVLALAGLAIQAGAACDKVPLTAPSSSTITLSAPTAVLPVNGATEVSAVVLEAPGTPVQNGTVVSFTATLGTVDPQEARTKDGKVTVVFRAGSQSGEASISAASGGATVSQALAIKIGGAAAAKIVLSASPTSVPVTGGVAQLVAIVLDASGNTLAGVPVTFVATAGTLESPTAVTGANGDARTTIRTDRETTVTAAAGAESAQVVIRAVSGPSGSISLATASPIVGQTTSFNVTASASSSGSPIQQVVVSFGDGDSTNLGAMSSSTTVAHVYRWAGTYTATVTVTDTAGFQTQVSTVVNVTAAPPLAVTITAGSLTPIAGTPLSFTVNVSVSGGGTAPAIRRYEWDFGDGSGVLVTTGAQTSHAFAFVGIKVVRVTVVAVDGSTGVGQIEVSVRPAT